MSEKFWILELSGTRTARWDTGNKWRKHDYEDCLANSDKETYISFGGPANRVSNLRVVLKTKDIGDFVWTIPDCLIQSHVLEMFRNEGFTGFEARQALTRIESSTLEPDLWELMVTGWGGMATAKSGVVRIPETNIWEGYPDWSCIVDPNSWDGSDFFIVWPFAFTRLVSDRVAKFIREKKLTGVKLVTPDAYTRWYMWSNLRQIRTMRLRDHYPEERAREVGEPLGIY
ncbi:MAG: hypothetical protein ABFD54_07270 [Armatimonadota bacterium]|nr:hypothetical protein [bacterium]